jgi:hypothetical protein
MPLTPQQIIHYYYSGGGALSDDPYDYSGLKFDINPTVDLSGLADQAAIVSYTEGVSGITLTPSSQFRRPIKQANALGSFSSIKVTALCDMVGTKTDWDFMHQGPITLFGIIKTTIATRQSFFESNRRSPSSIGIHIGIENPSQCVNFTSKGSVVIGINSLADLFTTDVFHLHVLRLDPRDGGMGADLWIDNVHVAHVDAPSNAGASTDSSSDNPIFFKSSNQGSTTNFFTGELLRWFGYNELRTDEEIAAICGGLDTTFFPE